jgi:hypothetical protein
MSEIRVHMRHARAAKITGRGVLCAPSVRLWFEQHELDYRRFLRDGLPVEDVEATGDAFALRACALAREESSRG